MNAVATIPALDDLRTRLAAVDDDPHAVAGFHPYLLGKAGRTMTGMGLVLSLHLAVMDYTDGMPPVAAWSLLPRLEEYVRAMTDDARVRADALDALRALGLL